MYHEGLNAQFIRSRSVGWRGQQGSQCAPPANECPGPFSSFPANGVKNKIDAVCKILESLRLVIHHDIGSESANTFNVGGPGEGLNSFYGPWLEQVDLGLARTFHISEKNAITLQAQAFNVLNHANYYVQNGTGINQFQYAPNGPNCGDGQTTNQTCYLIPKAGPGGFGTLQSINALNPPRVLQFAFVYRF